MNAIDSLLTSRPQAGVAPELLEMLGHKASALFLEKKVPLNDALREVLGPHGDFTNEHIKRVTEYANVRTYQQLHDSQKDKVIHFDIANPGTVIQDLRDGGSPAHTGKGVHGPVNDYALPPSSGKGMEKDEFADPESAMAHLFQMEGREGRFGQGDDVEKVASVDGLLMQRHANPYHDVLDQHIKLQAMKAHLTDAYESLDMLRKEAHEELYQAVRREVLDGAGINGVIGAFNKMASSELTGGILTPMVERLLQDGIRPADLQIDGVKVASAGIFLNPSHPIVSCFAGLHKCAQDMVRTEAALKEVMASLNMTTAFLARGLNP